MSEVSRRRFLENAALTGAAAGIALSAGQLRAAEAASNRVVVGVMGMSRGRSLAQSFASRPGVEVKYVCDVDSTRANDAATLIEGAVGKAPRAETDFHRLLDDKDLDALVCAAPNHWHAPATILSCDAGKHVYVEKPCSHNPWEGEQMVLAARKSGKAVQMGSQRRSGPRWQEVMRKLHGGDIGRVYLARSWYNSLRGSIGTGKPAPVPSNLNYELWQGPAPRRAYIDNVVHYNWHWRWHWGNGELGNNGVHTLDLCRWGLQADYPIRVNSSGGRYHFNDDQETPDTQTVCYEFEGGRQATWHGLSCNKHRSGFITFYGDDGTLETQSNGTHIVYDKNDKKVDEFGSNSQGDIEHIDNFIDCIRNDTPLDLNAEIEEGHKSTLLCHLGNIAQRVGRSLQCDASNGHIVNDDEAMRLWKREYENGWEPEV
jgi:predicted dehydrogenase